MVVVAAASLALWWSQRPSETPRLTAASSIHKPLPAALNYVGPAACATCHAGEVEAWQGSHHDLAMQVANERTVLGNFANATFEYTGITSTFSKRNGKFFVNTDGPDGKLADYEIKYTFGVTPLQQYLIEFPGGRMQALSIAWDARPKEEGGQRWFHLYPNERITHQDELHWTGPQQNWNFMCADCHATNLKKNYDATTHTFKTSWSEVNVSCEACHGPGSRHVAWAEQAAQGSEKTDITKGLTVSLREQRGLRWTLDPQSGTARPQEARPLHAEIEVCAPCHARRISIAEGFTPGKPFLDHYQPSLLEPRLYHIDGQQRQEVYTWGSFLQSKMYHQGVTCSDCHEPHSLKLRAPGNGVCAQCHAQAKYEAASHHFHEPDGSGAQCVNCHMPASTYMVIDPRRDHSLRVPRPDLSVNYGVPNACTQCHGDKPPQWAADQMVKWYGHPPGGFRHYAFAPHDAEAVKQLLALLENHAQPDIARATAAATLARMPDPPSVEATHTALADSSPLVRQAALAGMELLPLAQRVPFAASLLDDPVRMVRLEAARVLASVPESTLTKPQKAAFHRAEEEYVSAQRLHADRPEHRTNLGTFYAQRGRYADAETEFHAAIELLSGYLPAYVNFADLRRIEGRDQDAEAVLREGLKVVPTDASLHHALGLALVRLQRAEEAVRELAHAARLAPEESRFAYVYAVALHSTGRKREALEVLDRALARHPGERDMLLAAATFSRDTGDHAAALKYGERLAAEAPWDPVVQQLLKGLRRGADTEP